MSLRFACILVLCLSAAPALAQHSQPVFTFESGIQCYPYNECSTPTTCEQQGQNACGAIVTGEQACVPSANTRYNFVCCEENSDCMDAQGVQGVCKTFNQPSHGNFSLCIWDTPRNFQLCKTNLANLTWADFEACGGEVVGTGEVTVAQKLLAGDCDGDGTRNELDVCPCMFAGSGDGDGCPDIVPEDAGVTDAAVTDASSGEDSGTRADASAAANPIQFGGGGGCEGCAAGGAHASDLSLALLVLAVLVTRARRAR